MRQQSPKKSPAREQQQLPTQLSSQPTHDAPLSSYQQIANSGSRNQQLTQLKAIANGGSEPSSLSQSTTGLPAQLKQGVESLSGISMDGVQVHYNSAKPAQLKAEAYAQGSEIHLAPGKEKHLPHEAWHVVQQAQGRVKPTLQMKRGVAINDDAGLEREADEKGAEAMRVGGQANGASLTTKRLDTSRQPMQMKGGRRTVLDPEGKKTFLKLVLPGSGYEHWPTHSGEEIRAMKPLHDEKEAAPQLHWKGPKDDKWQVTIAGPTGKRGTSDTGPNSINNNVEKGYELINNQMIALAHDGIDATNIVVLIKGHSRNAVAATRIANELAKKWGKKGLTIELVAHDPVPGPGHTGTDVDITLAPSINSTVVYSMYSGWLAGFDPQSVHGSKRLILSLQQHDAGLTKHFNYGGDVYKGSNLNSLSEGLYISLGKAYVPVKDKAGHEKIVKAGSVSAIDQFLKDNPMGSTETVRWATIEKLAKEFGLSGKLKPSESSSEEKE